MAPDTPGDSRCLVLGEPGNVSLGSELGKRP